MNEDRLLGEFRNMSFEDYMNARGLSNSAMKPLVNSPWHYKNRVYKPSTKSMLSGTLLHCAALEPEAVAQRYVILPEDAPRRPTAAQWKAAKPNASSADAMAWWAEFNKSVEGRDIVTADQYSLCQDQVKAILAVPELARLFAEGYTESSVFWVDQATGIHCKARPDLVFPMSDGRVILVDVKTTVDESPKGFARAVANFGYHRQDAHYRSGFEKATGKTVAAFVFAAVSSAPPVLAVPYTLSDAAYSQGAEDVGELMRLLADCRASDKWPAYGDGYQELDLPRYAQRSTETEVTFV